jgi:hypothetical protein
VPRQVQYKNKMSAIRIQIAGGLALNRIKSLSKFQDILRPVAPTLILTGDCMAPADPVNSKFVEYLKTNWNRVLYLAGPSEGKNFEVRSDILRRFKVIHHTDTTYIGIGRDASAYNVFTAVNSPKWSGEQRTMCAENLNDMLTCYPGRAIIASHGHLDEVVYGGSDIALVVQGCAEYNQFNVKSGPVINRRTDSRGLPRESYRPDFAVEVDGSGPVRGLLNINFSIYPQSITTAWPLGVSYVPSEKPAVAYA